jgi:hypothetical protein
MKVRLALASLLPACAVLLGMPSSLLAQVDKAPDSTFFRQRADAGVYLVHWVKQDNPREQTVYFKNTAKFPLQVTDWEVYDCMNIGNKDCGPRTSGPLLKPGQTVKLITIVQRDRYSGYSYHYRFHVAWGPGVVPDSTASPGQ